MYSVTRYAQAMETWQTACVVYGKMVVSAQETMLRQSMDRAQLAMRPDEAMRKMQDRQATFARSYQVAAQAAAARRGANRAPWTAFDPLKVLTETHRGLLTKLEDSSV